MININDFSSVKAYYYLISKYSNVWCDIREAIHKVTVYLSAVS
jgi:hypothetical protein